MNLRKDRSLLWSGFLGAVILFAGDMPYYAGWESGQFSSSERMAHVAVSRLHLGSITGPVGLGFKLLGVLGL